jgi:hypothetical protein
MKKFNQIREENEKTASKIQEDSKDQKTNWDYSSCLPASLAAKSLSQWGPEPKWLSRWAAWLNSKINQHKMTFDNISAYKHTKLCLTMMMLFEKFAAVTCARFLHNCWTTTDKWDPSQSLCGALKTRNTCLNVRSKFLKRQLIPLWLSGKGARASYLNVLFTLKCQNHSYILQDFSLMSVSMLSIFYLVFLIFLICSVLDYVP